MELFHFKSRGDALFGVYHPAANPLSRQCILICPPIFSDYCKSYGSLRRLAEMWSTRGFHVLRFDYFGTGDSSGTIECAGPQRWKHDIVCAANELIAASGCQRVTLFGVRLGAALAVLASNDIDSSSKFIAWDPVFDGRRYRDQLLACHHDFANSLTFLPEDQKTAMHDLELLGYDRPEWIDTELTEMVVSRMNMQKFNKFLAVLSKDSSSLNLFDNSEILPPDSTEVYRVDESCRWESASEDSIYSTGVLDRLRACL